ncbi:hypothetical protein SEUCBS140593_005645 [Sporothrix eucalyptigena]|uniref:N,N-dimethylformamidase beta subunit-like C-terminal domain-containing protein n=1 Tax=Sporothrix eucalyptigena TaxID=1812306 RepID=A0ABP0BY62_9PEZI
MAFRYDKDTYPAEIIGYAEPWIVSPGDTVSIKVSCTEPEYTHRTVRLIQGIGLDHAPKKVEEEITEVPRGKQSGRFQQARPGSYAVVPCWCPSSVTSGGIQVSFYMQPSLLDCPHIQTLVSTLPPRSSSGFSISINTEGSLVIQIATGSGAETVPTGLKPQLKVWSKVELKLEACNLELKLTPLAFRAEPVLAASAFEHKLPYDAVLFDDPGSLFVAAAKAETGVTDHFNGRVDSLTIKTLGDSAKVLAQYDFSLEMGSDRIVDVSGNGRHGRLANAPTRAVTGHDWDGTDCDWTRARHGYGAIHFHDDDLDDAAWETDFTISVPKTARSGAYAVEVATTNGKDTDSIVFFVRHPSSTADNNKDKVCLVFSTFTYLAYANERLYDTSRVNTADLGPGFDINKTVHSAEFPKMRRRTDLGLSCYDRHNDGSGVCYSSGKRPILNVRPGYIMWAFSRPREFSADLFMVNMLEANGIPYEVLTDHDLHARGGDALAGFNTVITGCHPEYPSLQSFGAYNAYARAGGNLMYMGGNGFYWVSALGGGDEKSPHRLEIRRGDVGVRPYSIPGGEHVTASGGGQRAGLWRSRGLSCNTLFGVGFCAQGTGPGVPYKRTDVSQDAAYKWIFDGVEGELIGENGFGGGASGDEIDRFDIDNGSPAAAVVLASSTGHSDDYGIAIEDISYPALNTLGTQTDRIRSDIVYYKTAAGGAVFSVGSINWYCSMAWDAYDNNVARMTLNVIKGFLAGKHRD